MSYLGLHRIVFALLATALLAAGCTAGAKPSVNVLGVSQPHYAEAERQLTVFVEVTNPTGRDLRLSRLEYRLEAPAVFEAEGRVSLARAVAAGSSTIVNIPVPLRSDDQIGAGVPYVLQGKLVALENSTERSWTVEVEGALIRDRMGSLSTGPARVLVADTAD